jgi:hypothetical protein
MNRFVDAFAASQPRAQVQAQVQPEVKQPASPTALPVSPYWSFGPDSANATLTGNRHRAFLGRDRSAEPMSILAEEEVPPEPQICKSK